MAGDRVEKLLGMILLQGMRGSSPPAEEVVRFLTAACSPRLLGFQCSDAAPGSLNRGGAECGRACAGEVEDQHDSDRQLPPGRHDESRSCER